MRLLRKPARDPVVSVLIWTVIAVVTGGTVGLLILAWEQVG